MKLRFGVLIPTYNNPATLQKVVTDTLVLTSHPIVVVDDGSIPPVELIANERVTLVRHSENLGKGIAIQTGFRHALKQGWTHLVSIDGDGQHLPEEISKLTDACIASPWSMVIGARKFTGEHVPKISKFGRNFSNFWVKFETDRPIHDSQSGFRAYPLFQVQNLNFFTSRFDFEIEILIRLLWRGVDVREISIEVHYPPPAERVSHFDKLWDNVRISCLNAALVTLSLLRVPQAPARIAAAVGLGAAIGATPLFGFHTMIAAAVALGLRLNFIALVLGTQVSVPPLIPVIFWIVHKIAHHLPFESHFARTACAFAATSALFGTVAFLLSFAVAQVFAIQRKKKTVRWSGKTRGGALGNGFMTFVLKTLGVRTAYFLIAFAIPYFYLFAPTARASLNQYYLTLMPDLGFFSRQNKILKHLYRFAQVLLDRAYQEHSAEACFEIRPNGNENILNAVHARTGLVMVTAHVGAWDLASFVLRKKEGASDFRMVKFEAEGLTFDKASGKSKLEQDHHLVKQQGGGFESNLIFEIREQLAQGMPVGFMADRPLGNQVELVPFFGKLAIFDITPMRIAKICKVPMLSTFGFKGAANQYDFYAMPSVNVSDPMQAAYDYCNHLEDLLRRYPDQWFNFFPFWSKPHVQDHAVQSEQS